MFAALAAIVKGVWLALAWAGRYFVLGYPAFGKPRDNASFLYAATKDYRDKPVERLSGPLWRRLARRWLVAGIPVALGLTDAAAGILRRSRAHPAGWTSVPWAALGLAWVLVVAVLGLGYSLTQLGRLLVHRRHTVEFIYPAWKATCEILGVKYRRRDASRMVILPPRFDPEQIITDPAGAWYLRLLPGKIAERILGARLLRNQKKFEAAQAARKPMSAKRMRKLADDSGELRPVRINLPLGKAITPGVQKNLVKDLGDLLGMPDAIAEWNRTNRRGNPPHLLLTPNIPPPDKIGWDQVRKHFEAASLNHPVTGLTATRKVDHADYENNSPHIMVSGGSGTGKSVFYKALLCQRMHWGAFLVVVDYKRVSHRWAHQLDGHCRYAWQLADIHNTMVKLGVELDRRIKDILPDDNSISAEPRQYAIIDLLVEEMNSTIALLQAHWLSMGGTGTSPAVLAFQHAVNMGREYGIHLHVAAQRASANMFGPNGGDKRESFQERFLAKWTVQTWKMLAGGMPFRRCPANAGRGVWAHIMDDIVTIFRTPFLTDAQAREWALSGVQPVLDEGSTLDFALSGSDRPSLPGNDAPAMPELVTIAQAAARLPVSSHEALRKALQRAGDHGPAPAVPGRPGVAALYDFDRLVEFCEQRAIEASWSLPTVDPRPIGIVYRFDVLQVDGAGLPRYGEPPVCGYIGETLRPRSTREWEHRGDKPWSDLIVGEPSTVWEGPSTKDELVAREREVVHADLPLYNYEHQEGAAHAVPKWTQKAQRHARDRAAGRPLWTPEDRYRKAGVPMSQ